MINDNTTDIVMLDSVMLDANVLFRQQISNILFSLHEQQAILIRWTHEIQNELIRNKINAKEKGKPKTKAELENKIKKITKRLVGTLVFNYEHLIPKMTNEKKDRHVLAAAVASGCSKILTYNKKDFKPTSTLPYGIEAQTPDEFLLPFANENHEYFDNFIYALKTQRSYLTNPPLSPEQYLDLLAGDGQGIPFTAKACLQFSHLI